MSTTPKYDYRCPACGASFEAVRGVSERWTACACGGQAERRPFSGVPNLQGATVARSIPDADYRYDAQKREFTSSWGGNDRTVEMMRKNSHEDPASGFRMLDIKGMNNDS